MLEHGLPDAGDVDLGEVEVGVRRHVTAEQAREQATVAAVELPRRVYVVD